MTSTTPDQQPPQPVPTASAPKPPPRGPQTMEAAPLDAQTNAEIEAAMQDMEAAGAAARRAPAPREGGARPAIRGPRVVQAGREHRTGVIVSVGPSDIFLEFGPKELGVMPRLQWPDDQLPAVGSQVEVVVDRFEPVEALFLCSRPGTVQKADWEMLEPGQVIEARVTGVNKGGLELEVASHKAFMPASQVSLDHLPDLSVFVGEKLKCQVSRVDRSGRGNIVLSRRELLEQERREQAEKIKATLAEGQIVEGVVRKIMAFGAFVDIGGVDGLVHISDLSHDRVGHGEKAVSRYVKPGEKVRVQILKLDWEHGRIGLGMKQVQADPFATAANEIAEGAEATGRVTKILEFGAFVELAPGVEGLVHISELAWRRVGKVEEVLKPDEVVKVKVLKIDPENRRISLSIKALQPPPEPAAAPQGGGREGGGFGGGFGGGGFGGRGGGKGKRGRDMQGRPLEEIQKVTPELRRMREKFGKKKDLKGGIG